MQWHLENASQYVQSTCLIKYSDWINYTAPGSGHMLFLTQQRTCKKASKWVCFTQSYTARRVNSHSLGTDYNKLGHRTADLFGILKNSMLFFFCICLLGISKKFFLIKQKPWLWKCTACFGLCFLKVNFWHWQFLAYGQEMKRGWKLYSSLLTWAKVTALSLIITIYWPET